jgi:hypothetical protein
MPVPGHAMHGTVPYERKSGEAFNRDAGGSAPEALAMASCCQS